MANLNIPARGIEAGPLKPVLAGNDANNPISVVIEGGGTDTTSPIKFGDSASIDAFARARVSNPLTLFDSKQIWDDPDIANSAENYPLFYDNQEISGAGTTTTFDVNRASTALAVSNLTAGVRLRRTKQRFNYQPGKSMLSFLTFVMGNTSTGIIKRIGIYTDDNGIFFQSDEGVLGFGIRSNISGSPVDTVITQANWNIDTLDGTGPSGVTLDITKSQILVTDYEWLGVGRVRFGFVIDGIPVYCHQVLNSNQITSVYMSDPNNPVSCEIINDGTGGIDSIEQICSTIISEGGVQPNGVFRAPNPATVAATIIQANVANTPYAVAAIRLKTNYLSANIDVARVSMLMTTNDDFIWSLHMNPTLSGALTFGDIPNGAIQYSYAPTASPGVSLTAPGVVIDGGLISTDLEALTEPIDNALRLGSLIDGTRDVIVLAATPIGTNLDVRGMITWRESW